MATILQFPAKSSAVLPAETHLIRLEAEKWERRHGRDAYSAFLLKHGKRPAPGQAEVIGKIIGRRVKANDGFRYPKLSQAARAAKQTALRSRKDDRKKWENIRRLHNALFEADLGPLTT